MSKNKRTLIIIFLLISSMFPITTSGMQKKEEISKTKYENQNKELKILEKYSKYFATKYDLSKNLDKEELSIEEIEEKEKEYKEFIKNISEDDKRKYSTSIIITNNTISEIKKNINASILKQKLNEYKIIFSKYEKECLNNKNSEKTQEWIDKTKKEIKEKEKDYNDFYTKNKNIFKEDHNKINKNINNTINKIKTFLITTQLTIFENNIKDIKTN